MSEQAQMAKKTSSTRRGVPHRRPRKRLSCEPCRNAKLRCDRQQPCAACTRRECETACTFRATRETVPVVPSLDAPGIISEPLSHIHGSTGLSPPSETDRRRSTSPTPQGCPGTESRLSLHENEKYPATSVSLDAMLERPAFGQDDCAPGHGNPLLAPFAFGPKVPMNELLSMLPSSTVRDYLVSRYFTYQAPLFHVLHGPTFQKQYTNFDGESAQTSLPWLALLFVICSSAIHTLDFGDPILNDSWPTSPDIHASCHPLLLSRHLRSAALTCLSEARFMVHYNLNTLEALLIMIYGICHSESVDRGWVFLGVALNMGIALRCNVDSQDLNCIEKERRRRCWAGILMLHTYQGILFWDIDMSFLLTISATMPADVNDSDIREDQIQKPSSRPTGMSLMRFKIRLFELSTQICSCLSDTSTFDEASMNHYDSLIASEQQQWNSVFLPEGSPSLLDTASYAYWCILQTYAHQLYLLIHRPFYHSQSPRFLPSSRTKYLLSSIALLDLHQQICELPILRPYRWLANGMTSFNALQGAVALAACLMDKPGRTDTMTSHNASFDAAVQRIESLQKFSPVCARAYPALQNLQAQLSDSADGDGDGSSQEWATNTGWLDLNSIDWVYWDGIISDSNQCSY